MLIPRASRRWRCPSLRASLWVPRDPDLELQVVVALGPVTLVELKTLQHPVGELCLGPRWNRALDAIGGRSRGVEASGERGPDHVDAVDCAFWAQDRRRGVLVDEVRVGVRRARVRE